MEIPLPRPPDLLLHIHPLASESITSAGACPQSEDKVVYRLYAKRPGEWETVLIKWNDFVRTNHGMVVEPQTELLRERVKSIGIGSIDRQVGRYDLAIEKIWATNDPEGKLNVSENEARQRLESK